MDTKNLSARSSRRTKSALPGGAAATVAFIVGFNGLAFYALNSLFSSGADGSRLGPGGVVVPKGAVWPELLALLLGHVVGFVAWATFVYVMLSRHKSKGQAVLPNPEAAAPQPLDPYVEPPVAALGITALAIGLSMALITIPAGFLLNRGLAVAVFAIPIAAAGALLGRMGRRSPAGMSGQWLCLSALLEAVIVLIVSLSSRASPVPIPSASVRPSMQAIEQPRSVANRESPLPTSSSPAAEGPRDLLRNLDHARDTLIAEGSWSLASGELTFKAQPGKRVCVNLAVKPPEEYELRITANAGFDVLALANGKLVRIVFENKCAYIDGYINGHRERIGQRTYADLWPASHEPREFIVTVRKNGIQATVDEAVAIDWKGDPSMIELHYIYRFPTDLALESWSEAVTFSRVQLSQLPTTPIASLPTAGDRPATTKTANTPPSTNAVSLPRSMKPAQSGADLTARAAYLKEQLQALDLPPKLLMSDHLKQMVSSIELRGPGAIELQKALTGGDWLKAYNLVAGTNLSEPPPNQDVDKMIETLRDRKFIVLLAGNDLQAAKDEKVGIVGATVTRNGLKLDFDLVQFEPHPDGIGLLFPWTLNDRRSVFFEATEGEVTAYLGQAIEKLQPRIDGIEMKLRLGELSDEQAQEQVVQMIRALRDALLTKANASRQDDQAVIAERPDRAKKTPAKESKVETPYARARSMLNMAEQYLKIGETDKARDYARRIIVEFPESPETKEAATIMKSGN